MPADPPTPVLPSPEPRPVETTLPFRPIRRLPPGLVDRIAAGEVVERPASVVKELIDNALDAGATQVEVEVAHGGTSLIRVTDNGRGMDGDDLTLAFAAHATSKLAHDEDLQRITTMGFRGEALASIGAVSDGRILSRRGPDGIGHEVIDRAGDVTAVRAAPANPGTTVEVRDLFHNVPARRKFLRAIGTESGAVTEAMTRIALSHHGVTFRLIRDGRTVLDWPSVSEADRWLTGWPGEFRDRYLRLDARDAPRDTSHAAGSVYGLRGVIGLPETAAVTPRYQFLYVNGRPIRDKTISHALREAYRGLTEPGRYPPAVLLLTLDSGDVDVNVHPTKSEVRFRDANRVHGLVLSAVREVLLGNDLTPAATPGKDTINGLRPAPLSSASAPSFSSLSSSGTAVGEDRETMRARLAALLGGLSANPDGQAHGTPYDPVHAPAGGAFLPRLPALVYDPTPATSCSLTDAPPVPSAYGATVSAVSGAIQLHNSYLVAESDDGLEIIDQHALHERILFEELLERVGRGPLESQHLLLPVTFQATPGQIAALETTADLLGRLGVEAEPFGPDAVAVRAFPTFLGKLDPAAFVRELLEIAESESFDAGTESALHEVLDLMACKAAVKAGDRLTPEEIAALLTRRADVSRLSNCPHGRPTTLRLSLKDLERQFKRTGF